MNSVVSSVLCIVGGCSILVHSVNARSLQFFSCVFLFIKMEYCFLKDIILKKIISK
jgi:hypothetical protein